MIKGEAYTYLWLRRDGTPYYVGKGTWRDHKFIKQERAYRKGAPSTERVILQTHLSEEDAFFAEIFMILFYGRIDIGTGRLRNLTDGGEGGAGHIATAASIWKRSQSLSKSKKGKPIAHYDPKRHSKLMSGSGNPMYGVKRKFDPEWCRRLSAGKLGHIVTDATKQKMSLARKAYWERRQQCSPSA